MNGNLDYLNIGRASDLASPLYRAFYRFLEIVPGAVSWATLALGLILSWIAPLAVAIFIIAFDFYWFCRVLYLAVHQISSYYQMKKNIKTDWMAKLDTEKKSQWRDIHHLVILPFAGEERGMIRTTMDSLVACDYPKDHMIILFALEDRGAAIDAFRQALDGYKGKFRAILSTVHPRRIPGEIQGKGANVNWAISEFKEKYLPQFGVSAENIVASVFDIDTHPYASYFSCLTWFYLNSDNRLRKSYQPIPVYNNNIWEAPLVSRIIATSSTFWEMMQQERPEQLVTFSSHSMPLKTLMDIGYPRNIVSDDSRIFWRCYFAFGGGYKVIPMYYPVSMDAVAAKSAARTMLNQYKQQRRWSWGVENLPYVCFNFFANPAAAKIKIREKLFHILVMLEGFWSWATCSILTFGLGWLPLWFGGSSFNNTLLSYNLPRFTSQIMTAAMVGMIVSAIISLLLLPPRPKNYGFFRSLLMVFQWLFLPLTLIFFGSFPALESQTRLMINKPLGFWVTEKSIKK